MSSKGSRGADESHGIDPPRITTIGYGERLLITTDLTEEGMQRNRRSVAVFKRKVR